MLDVDEMIREYIKPVEEYDDRCTLRLDGGVDCSERTRSLLNSLNQHIPVHFST